jgi:dipeptidyl aminopeptidase/acylaminoacyl peptidase
MMELDGGNPTLLTLSPDQDEMMATCSPDGTRLLFERQRGADRELYLETLGQTDERPLTDTEGENYAPAWSPLLEVIAFLSSRDGQTGVWVMDSGGGNARKLTTLAGEYGPPQWSPDGALIVYAANRSGQYDLYAYELASNIETQLTNTPDVNESLPSLGFDLQSLAYIADQDPQDPQTGALWLLNQPAPLVTAGGRVDTPTWIDNGQLLLSANLGGITHILLVNTEQNRQSLLTNLGPTNRHPRPCFWAEGGQAAVLPLGEVPTPTPSATPNLVSAYTPVVNPGADWQNRLVELTVEDLQSLALQDFRLGNAQASLTEGVITYRWVNETGNTSQLDITLDALAGSLDVKLSNYSIDGQAVGVNFIHDLAFMLREAILSRFLNAGLYHLRGVQFEEDRFTLTFALPPN